jgi:hypothetical protein
VNDSRKESKALIDGKPEVLRSDNGREFIADSLGEWLAGQGVKTAFIEKGSPQQNAFVVRFKSTMRDEVLNGEEFDSILEARVVIGEWLVAYNTIRPHRGLGMLTPARAAQAEALYRLYQALRLAIKLATLSQSRREPSAIARARRTGSGQAPMTRRRRRRRQREREAAAVVAATTRHRAPRSG